MPRGVDNVGGEFLPVRARQLLDKCDGDDRAHAHVAGCGTEHWVNNISSIDESADLFMRSRPRMCQNTKVVQSLLSQVGYSAGHVKNVHVVQSLWAGYGSLYACSAANGDRLIVKHFTPPAHRRVEDDSEDHKRKLRSYDVERVFYEALSQRLLDAGCIVPSCVGCIKDDDGSIAIVMRDLGAQYGKYDVRRGNSLSIEEGKRLLSYLARWHSIFWLEQQLPEGLWDEGCFWQLGTRLDELQYLDRSWRRWGLDRDMAMKIHNQVGDLPHRCLVHGDAKAANFFFFEGQVGGYDLQYTGGGSPMRDIAYTLGCSMQEHLIVAHEEALLRHYHDELTSLLSPQHAADFSFETMKEAYDLCVTDLVRFMCGSRWWGNECYLETKAKAWLENQASR